MLIQAANIATEAAKLLSSEHEAERVFGLTCLAAVTAAGVGLPAHIMEAVNKVEDKPLGFRSVSEMRLHASITLGQVGPVTPIRTVTPLRRTKNAAPVPFLDTASLLSIEFVAQARGAEGFHSYAVTDDLRLVAECEGGYTGFTLGQLSSQAGLDLPAMNPECELRDE